MIVLGWLTARWSGLQLAIRYTLLGIACLSGWLWPDRKIVPSNKKQTLTFYHLSLFLSLCLHLLLSFVLVPVSTSVFWYLGSVSLWRSTSTANGKTLHILNVCCFQGLDSSTFKQSEAIKTHIYICIWAKLLLDSNSDLRWVRAFWRLSVRPSSVCRSFPYLLWLRDRQAAFWIPLFFDSSVVSSYPVHPSTQWITV